MKSNQGKKSIMYKLYMLTGVCVAGLFIFGAVAYTTVNIVKVNGPHYQRVVQNKDLLADVLPPPNFIVETYLTAEQMRDAKDKSEFNALLKRYAQLKADFATRQDYWSKNLEDGPLKQEINETSRKPAEEFFAVMDNELIPAMDKGDIDAVKNIYATKLPPLYGLHRDAIDKIVDTTTKNAT